MKGYLRPGRDSFTDKEWAIIQRHRTPSSVQGWLNSLRYNTRRPETMMSFREVVRQGTAHCLEAALAAGVILEQHGHPLKYLDIDSKDGLGHVALLYKVHGRWGAVARSRDPGLHGRRPVFRTIRQVVDSFFDPFIDHTGRITGYAVGDLRDLGAYDWRFSKRGIWKVERYLIDLPHTPFRSSESRYRTWLKRYKAFKREHPGLRPVHYRDRRTWLPGYMRFKGP